MRRRLYRRVLACHCKVKGVPCHASVLAAIADASHAELFDLLAAAEEARGADASHKRRRSPSPAGATTTAE